MCIGNLKNIFFSEVVIGDRIVHNPPFFSLFYLFFFSFLRTLLIKTEFFASPAHQSELNMYMVGSEGGSMLGYYKNKKGGQGF